MFELGASSSNDSDPTLQNCLFSAVTLTKNTDIDKYGYSGYAIEFDRRSSFSFPGRGFGKNVLIFGADMSSSAHTDNKKRRHISSRKRTNTRIRTYVNGTEIYKFKAKDSQILVSPICPGNISKDWSVDNMKIAGFTGCL